MHSVNKMVFKLSLRRDNVINNKTSTSRLLESALNTLFSHFCKITKLLETVPKRFYDFANC